jgi:hypothetical protein
MILLERIINIFYPLEIKDHGFTTYRELTFLKHIRGFIYSRQAVEYFLECEFEDTCGSMQMMLAESWGTNQIEIILENISGLLDGMKPLGMSLVKEIRKTLRNRNRNWN